MSTTFPQPDLHVLERRDLIIQGLAQLVAPEALITSEDERRAFETDALTRISHTFRMQQPFGAKRWSAARGWPTRAEYTRFDSLYFGAKRRPPGASAKFLKQRRFLPSLPIPFASVRNAG